MMPSLNTSANTRTMRLLVVSDVVEQRLYDNSIKEWLGHVDLLVSCGDLPPQYLDFLESTLNVPLMHVLGNHCFVHHEPNARCAHEDYLGAYDLNGRVTEYDGLILAGMEGSPLYNNGPHQYTEQEVNWSLMRLYPALLREKMHTGRYLDVMVTHAPPRGIQDDADVAHRGFKSLLPFIDRFKPAILLHGHTHHYDPRQPSRMKHGDTCIINVYGHELLELAREDNKGWAIQC